MKTAAMILAAGIASSAVAQDITITVDPFGGTVSAQYNGANAINQVWSSISVRLTGDAAINITSQDASYTSLFSPGGALITGDGTDTVEFVGEAPGALGGSAFNGANPFEPFTFSYAGDVNAFGFELFSQNSIYFNDGSPFGNPQNMVNANNTAGPISYEVIIVPAPASAALLGLGGLAAIRRRR